MNLGAKIRKIYEKETRLAIKSKKKGKIPVAMTKRTSFCDLMDVITLNA